MAVALSLFALSVFLSSVRGLFADVVLAGALGCGCAAWWAVGGTSDAGAVAAVEFVACAVVCCAAVACAAAACVAAACAAAACAAASCAALARISTIAATAGCISA